jgi:hypothetical protein
MKYTEKLMDTDPNKRPSAKQACHWLWSKYRSYLETDFSRESSMEEIL